MKNILFLASEAVPFIKTGGLADVAGSLPKAFDKEYFDCRVMLPKYLCIPEAKRAQLQYVNHFYMDYLGQSRYVGILTQVVDGITYYFIDNEYYFAGDRPYGDWYWDLEKFCFFCYASLSALPVIGFRPDLIHCHDWQTGIVPVLLKDRFAGGEFFRGIKSVMTIHNLKFQGVWSVPVIKRFTQLSDYYFTPDKLECNKDGNLLKGGLVYADAITTVSNTYAEEIKIPYYGEGLDGLMRAREHDLRGIVNGIDYDEWNPQTDSFLPMNYTVRSFKTRKAKIKADFGSTHILAHREYLANAVANGKQSAGAWYDSEIELMTEQMVYGGSVFAPGCDGSTVPALYTIGCKQLNLFRHRPDLISNRQTYWLRDVVSAANFANVISYGNCDYTAASGAYGVRPAFPIY